MIFLYIGPYLLIEVQQPILYHALLIINPVTAGSPPEPGPWAMPDPTRKRISGALLDGRVAASLVLCGLLIRDMSRSRESSVFGISTCCVLHGLVVAS